MFAAKFANRKVKESFLICRNLSSTLPSPSKDALKKRQEELMRRGLPKRKTIEGVQHVILVSSGKGGVGKSTVAVNLSLAISRLSPSYKVSLLDADIFGPSVPLMMNISDPPLLDGDNKMVPVQNYGVGCMSMGLLMNTSSAAVWRGPMVMGALNKLIFETAWAGTDFLVVDLPPGTGDVHLSVSQTVAVTGAVVVTTPQKVAMADVRKGVDMFNKVQIPVLGVVQNMSGFVCTNCQTVNHIFGSDGARELAASLEVPLLADIPLDPEITSSGDSGKPLVISHPQSQSARIYLDMAQAVVSQIK